MGGSDLIKATLTAILNFLLGDFALPVAKTIGLRWTRLMTWSLPEEERDRQLTEYAADLENEIDHNIRSGQVPAQVAAITLIRNGSGAMGDFAEATSAAIQNLPNLKEGNMFMKILVCAALLGGALLGATAWLTGPNPETGLHMYIVAGIVGMGVGIAAPMAVIVTVLGGRTGRMGL